MVSAFRRHCSGKWRGKKQKSANEKKENARLRGRPTLVLLLPDKGGFLKNQPTETNGPSLAPKNNKGSSKPELDFLPS
jgi:hypothetical protein